MLTKEKVLELLEGVMDPEIPVISVIKLGIIDNVRVEGDAVELDMIPTFAGCPAIELMKGQIENAIRNAGAKSVTVNIRQKAWSSNRISERGRELLKDFGLSPPPKYDGNLTMETLQHAECPNCSSTNTEVRNPFGPTACRAFHFCRDCHETFEQMKPV